MQSSNLTASTGRQPCRYGDSRQMTLMANAIAIALTEGMSADDKNILGNLLTLVSAAILSMAAIESACDQGTETQVR